MAVEYKYTDSATTFECTRNEHAHAICIIYVVHEDGELGDCVCKMQMSVAGMVEGNVAKKYQTRTRIVLVLRVHSGLHINTSTSHIFLSFAIDRGHTGLAKAPQQWL